MVPLPFDAHQPSTPPLAPVVAAAVAEAPPLEVVELRALPFRAYAARFDDRLATRVGLGQLQCSVVDVRRQAGAKLCSAHCESTVRMLHFTLHRSTTPEQLEAAANRLLAACESSAAGTVVSYNVVLWRGVILMVPRSQECAGAVAIK